MFFKKDNNEDNYLSNDDNNLSKVAALLIHAAKIDENFSKSEETIIKQALSQIGVNNENLEKIFLDGKKIEENSNQILEFTKEVKNMEENDKIKIVETLWRIIYSNNEADIYETFIVSDVSHDQFLFFILSLISPINLLSIYKSPPSLLIKLVS